MMSTAPPSLARQGGMPHRARKNISEASHGRNNKVAATAEGWGNMVQQVRQANKALMHEAHARDWDHGQQPCSPASKVIRPRIYVYELPPELAPPPTHWRMVRLLKFWIERSPFYESNPHCADFFLVPSYPNNRIVVKQPSGPDRTLDVGDVRMARIFAHIRDRYPMWNRTLQSRAGPRHFVLLPCDHGPADCAYTRPNVPNKYGKQHREGAKGRIWPMISGADEVASLWGDSWELLNPASPTRQVFYLNYNGWSDGLRSADGSCLNCFQPGLDIRLPSPEGHECGVLCGLHMAFNKTTLAGSYVPTELQRVLLRRAVRLNPLLQHARGAAVSTTAEAAAVTRRSASGNGCYLSWTGSARGHNNPARNALLKLVGEPGVCVRNTALPQGVTTHTTPPPSIPGMMLRSTYCYAPRGWDNGDSDRYLPALLYGCIPIMSDRLEGMPFDELPDMDWSSVAFALEKDRLAGALSHLRKVVAPSQEAEMRRRGVGMVQRLMYTSVEFSQLPGRGVDCSGCASSRKDCPKPTLDSKRRGAARGVPKGMPLRKWEAIVQFAAELRIDLDREEVCGARSYLGEDGAHDAYHALMQVLARRLSNPPAPLEPWVAAYGTKVLKYPLPRSYYAARARYYVAAAGRDEAFHTLLRAVPPAAAHLDGLLKAIL